MQVYAALYHAFMPPLYAVTLYQGLHQVYATRAPLGFIPDRSSSCRSLQHKKTSSKSPPYPQVFINLCILSNMFSLFRSEALRVPKAALASRTITSGTPVPMSSVRPWSRGREVFSGTSFLMNPVLPAHFISAYAVALFRFMLVLCNARDLSWLCLGPA